MKMKTIENLDTGYQDIKINLNGTKSINVTKTKDNTDTIHTMPIKDELVGNYKQKINLIIDKFIHECKLKNYRLLYNFHYKWKYLFFTRHYTW